MANLIKGQEDFLYVWTLGVKGIGDGYDKLVTLDVNPRSNGNNDPSSRLGEDDDNGLVGLRFRGARRTRKTRLRGACARLL